MKQLPQIEHDRLGISFEHEISVNSPEASNLFRVWKIRQEELKQAMQSMIQPAEHMAALAQQLKSDNITDADVEFLLEELESFIDDVDNARDFHTIGGWDILISYLMPGVPSRQRALAAWTVGSAIKDEFDYQQWILEYPNMNSTITLKVNKLNNNNNNTNTNTDTDINTNQSTFEVETNPNSARAIDYLLDMLDSPITSESLGMHRYAIYALSAASRGNIYIQEQLLASDKFLNAMKKIAQFGDVFVENSNGKHT